ncbi:hypothetical protein HO173_013210 [Letharia columbiana]|uniref:Ubiquitin-like domain-containing protein n=1 Tax=Letharia columbiana TaxID=112416 RepID=A0A8H6CHU5_9LECA|nr:uncharacterized protein HO173_013210 [Letharia columbiana]KAF6223784.1 hypothetical protein HO173_013210 [Letharia columbiana]
MPYNITIDHTNTAHSSDHSDHSDHSSSSSVTDDEDSTGTGVQVRPRSVVEGHEYSDPVEEQDGSWNVVYRDEIGPSDSASRPRTSNQQRPFVEAPRPEEARRPSFRRHISREPARHLPHPRAHRSPPSEPPESVDPHEEWQGYARGPPQHYSRPYAHYAPGYPHHAYQAYPAPSAVPGGLQQIVPYGFSPYQAPTGGPASSYFAHGHHGGPSHEMIPHAPSAGYFPYGPQGYQMPMPMPMSPPVVYPAYGGMYAHPPTPQAPPAPPAPAATTPPPPPPPPPPPSTSDTSKDDEKFARLEKLFLDQKAEQQEKAAAAEKAANDKAAKAEADSNKAKEIAAASAAAAAAAKEEVEKEYQAAAKDKAAKAEADAKKAEEIAAASAAAAAAAKEEFEKEHQDAIKAKAAKAEAEAKKAEEIAAAVAAATATVKPSSPPKTKDKPIKFKDAIGRRFNFPFDVCNTWSGMEYLIKEAFLHVADLGPHVADGQYDLLGPKDEIIMPSIWESVVEPGWEITMHMWPIPEAPEGGDALAGAMADVVIVEPEKKGKKKKEKIPPFMIWTAGKSNKGRGNAKGKKK